MKVKNIVFSGVMGAILMSVTGANAAAPISVASRGYVDQQVSQSASALDSAKANKATTLAGYGITDAYTAAQIDDKFELQTDAQLKLEAANKFTTDSIKALSDALGGSGGEGGEATGLTSQVLNNTQDINALKTQVGEGDVAARIANALSEAKSDAKSKADTAEQNAKEYADGLNTAMDTRVVSLETDNTTNKTDIAGLKEDKADKATTLSGYGITDAYTKDEADAEFLNSAEVTAAITTATSTVHAQVATNTSDIATLSGTKADKTTLSSVTESLGGRIETNKTNIEALQTDVAALAGDGDGSVAKQIATVTEKITGVETAYKAADESLTAAVQQAQADATQALSDAGTKSAQALTDAKAYTDELANGAVQTNTNAIAAINNAETGILAQAKVDAAAQAKAVEDKLKLLATADVPAECESESSMCVLSYNGTTYSWMPLTTPLE